MIKAKSKINRILCAILLLTVVFIFSACCEVRAMTVVNDNGTIDELVYVTLNNQQISNTGYSITDIKQDVSNTGFVEAKKIVEEFDKRIYVEILSTADEDTKEELRRLLGGIEILGNEWKGNDYLIGLRFRNNKVYRHYYNISGESSVKPREEKHFFYDKIIYEGMTMYVNYNSLYNNIYNKYTEKYPELISSENKIMYTYVSNLRREHSDADFITKMNGKYYHTWELEDGKTDLKITLYYNVANRSNWILVCVGTSILVGGILLIIGLIIEKSKKNKENIKNSSNN